MADRNLSLYKTNWNKFEEAMNDVVRKEVCRVFLWLYKGGNKPVWQYLDEIPGGKKGLNKDEKNTLSKKEPATNMDISLLYRLLQRTCGLPEASDPVWLNPPDPGSTSLEHTLYLIKEERNTQGHEGHKREAKEMTDIELDQKLSHLHRLCADLLGDASMRCDRLGQTVKLTDSMEARLREIQGVTADRFILMAREEKLKGPRTKMADEWYQQPLLRLQSQPVELANLLQWLAADGAAPSFVLVCGEAGVGKSSLCRYLEECWLRPRSDGEDLLQHYRLVLRVNCGDICTSDPVRLLKEELLKEAASRCSSYTLSEILNTVPVLWVLDGLEEATKEANKFLSSLLRNRRPKSTVLVTSRPEYGRDLLRRPHDGTQLAVSILGTNPLETIKSVILSAKSDECTMRHAKTLMDEFKKLDRRVQQELQNPLKLRLALQGWEAMRTSTLRKEFELSRLYQKIMDAQIKSLSEKVREELSMTKENSTRTVKNWFSFFCESTFHLVQSRKMFIGATSEAFLKKLEDKCDYLRISSSMCMSTFLASPDSLFSPGNNRYTFYHDSQVHFLAALHIASVMGESEDLHADTLGLFNIAALQEHAPQAPPLLHFLHVLLLLVSLIGASTPDGNIGMMIKLLLNAIPLNFGRWMWFEVAKKASFEPRVMREIGKVIPSFWIIEESSIEAAREMLEYQQPDEVILRPVSKPEEVNELEPLIHTLARLPIIMHLALLNHTVDLSGNDTADAYLEIICRKESRCILAALCGHLGKMGYGLLKHPKIITCCKSMRVKVKSIDSLEALCESVQRFQSLALHLVIAMKELPYTSAKLPAVRNSVYLPYVTQDTATNTAKFVARLSSSYDQLAVGDMAQSAIETFIRGLEDEDVTVNSFWGHLKMRESELHGFEFGPLPLEYSWEEFRQRWSRYRSLIRLRRPARDA